jgi:uncharacterized protein (TIGR02231 family)
MVEETIMRPLASLIALLSALSAAPAAASTPLTSAPSRIDAVTVYRHTARVTRLAHVELGAGAARVVLDGLPLELDDDSVRVEGKGSARARVFGVAVDRVTIAETVAGEARAAEERLQALQDEDRALEDRARVAKARAAFVETLRSTYSEERAKNLAVRGVSRREWAELASFVEAELTATSSEQRKVEIARRELARRTAQARADVERVQAKRGQARKAIAVELEVERAGALELAVSYAVPSAGWEPVWDARLAPDTSTMELSFQGSVWQRTGEDWSNVRLAVSTAQPGRGLFVPQLEPLYLARFEPPVPMRQGFLGAARPAAPPAAKMERKAKAAPAIEPEEAEEAAPVEDLAVPTATVSEGLLATSFTAPRRETIDGAGQARKVALARFPLKAEVVRTAAPRVEAAAFLTAKAVNDTGFPLLAGVAGVYVGDQFVGRAPLPATPAGGEITLAFGADDRVEVDRKVLERRRGSAGIVSKDDVYLYRVRIGLKNRYASPVAVKLLDLVPVSRDEKIRVELLGGSTAATREDPERPGVKIWELSLAPREEKVVELKYEVRYPKGMAIAGLE